jgi:hypothetical protein
MHRRMFLGSGPNALHGDLSMTAPQSSGTEAIRVDIRQDATHPKKFPCGAWEPEQKYCPTQEDTVRSRKTSR